MIKFTNKNNQLFGQIFYLRLKKDFFIEKNATVKKYLELFKYSSQKVFITVLKYFYFTEYIRIPSSLLSTTYKTIDTNWLEFSGD